MVDPAAIAKTAAAAAAAATNKMNPSNKISDSGGGDNAYYVCDTIELDRLRATAPWMNDPRYLQRVAISPSAVMKMMMHCQAGVEKGMARGGGSNPVEVMGLLLGRPDPTNPTTLVVTDAFALPIEGFETRVIADDEAVVNHMIALGESLEATRKEKFMGWYHSHPFDVGPHSHCFLSQTDLSTQLQWQRAEDPHGNPFVAIVVDPLRSTAQGRPELKAFRAYPPEYNPPVVAECPNGTIEPVEQLRLEQWGSCWNRYYELSIEYYMSTTSRQVLTRLTQDYFWIRTLTAGPYSSGSASTPTSSGGSARTRQLQDCYHSVAHAATFHPSSSGGPGSAAVAAVTAGSGGGSSAMGAAAVSAGSTAGSASSSSSTGVGGGGMAAVSSSAHAGGNPRGGGGGGKASTAVNPRIQEWSKAVEQLVSVAKDDLSHAALQEAKKTIFG